MKKIKFITVLSAALILLPGCGTNDPQSGSAVSVSNSAKEGTSAAAGASDASGDDIDIDLTKLEPDMIYAQVFDMVYNGDNYLGKKVKVKGPFAYYQEYDGREFFAVLINDAAACCSQGIEFVLANEAKYPQDYPDIGKTITVTGEFNHYEENGATYCQLMNAEMEVDKQLSW